MTPEDLDDVDACVFDCDGTLIDTMGLFYAADVKACEEVGVTIVGSLLCPGWCAHPRYFRAIVSGTRGGDDGGGIGRHGGFVWDARARARNASSDRVRGGDRERGEEAESRRRGELGREGELVERHLREHGLLAREGEKGDFLFDVVVTCEDVARGKPAPDLYLLACERLGVSPSRRGVRGRRFRHGERARGGV